MKIGIIGASGYTGKELIKILKRHDVELPVLNSNSYVGKKVSELYPEIGDKEIEFTGYSYDEINKIDLDLVFLAVPHKTAMAIVPKLKTKIVDLSADYRFKDLALYEETYGVKHTFSKKAVYGLPEMFREEIKKAELVANPGCYATLCILSALPLIEENIAERFIFDCTSGYSGAGREKAESKEFQEKLKENFFAYDISSHRHLPEIKQFLGEKVSFTPHVLPIYRGMLCTMHAELKKKTSREELIDLYNSRFGKEQFVKVIADDIPDMKLVQNTNDCAIGGFEIDAANQLIIISALDNLVKGASGQAVQNMNLMLGFDEEKGLR